MTECLFCGSKIYPGEKQDLFNDQGVHEFCLADFLEDQAEDAWASSEHADG